MGSTWFRATDHDQGDWVRARMYVIALSLGLTLMHSSAVQANPKLAMTEQQASLYNEAVALAQSSPPELDRAKALMEEALEAGERFDLLLLGYAWVLLLRDECDDASRVFEEVARAPHESNYSKQTLDDMRQALVTEEAPTLCSAFITIECKGTGRVSINDRPSACHTTERVRPGAYEIVFEDEQGSKQHLEVRLTGQERETVTFEAGLPTLSESLQHSDSTPSRSPRLLTGAASGVILGIGLGGVGVWLGEKNVTDIASGRVDQSTGRGRARLANTLISSGIVAGGAGVVLMGVHFARPARSEETQSYRLDFRVAPTGAHIRARF